MATFGTLSDRLTETFRNLRTKGKLSPADVDGTVREIRRALLDADVALSVVKDFTSKVRERALGDEVNRALNPAQQVVQIVNEELITILGGEQRRLEFAKTPPTVIMLAGLQGSGKTTFAVNSLTTVSATSASSRARRISRTVPSTSAALRRPLPRRFLNVSARRSVRFPKVAMVRSV